MAGCLWDSICAPSPSTRRVWIEIVHSLALNRLNASPSTRRVWIEIGCRRPLVAGGLVTLHTEGVDRNFHVKQKPKIRMKVTLHTEGVDRNFTAKRGCILHPLVTLHTEGVDRNVLGVARSKFLGVTLHTEGVDRNWILLLQYSCILRSPSTRRVWIEMRLWVWRAGRSGVTLHTEGVDRNWLSLDTVDPDCGHPPHGGCG